MGRAATPAVRALVDAAIEHRLHAYEHDPGAPSYGQEAVEHLGVEAARVLKTLVVAVDEQLAVGVVPVSAQLDLRAMAGALGVKRVAMADVDAAQRATGYVVGAISPIGQRRRLRTIVDAGAAAWDTVFCSAGRRGLEVELRPADLVRATEATLAPIATT